MERKESLYKRRIITGLSKAFQPNRCNWKNLNFKNKKYCKIILFCVYKYRSVEEGGL